ncbi:MAG TPA: hypothetical protein VMU75_01920 [Acidimicrobiales bacterium]|nr:hypothetical protein [Acidimicrobiales bacterium]
MATKRQVQAARRNVRLALAAARRERMLASMTAPAFAFAGDDAAMSAASGRFEIPATPSRAELYEEAQRQELPGRSRMDREQLARALRRT